MNVALFRSILAPPGQELLRRAAALEPREETFLADLARLSRESCAAPPELVRAALEIALLREKAAAKFSRGSAMYFTREALEQATAEPVSRHRAARFAPFPWVGDLGCGIGGDTLGLAGVSRVVAVDRDAVRLHMARENLRAYGLEGHARFVEADLRRSHLLDSLGLQGAALFCDPSRREAGHRRFTSRAYSPPLSLLLEWQRQSPERPTAVKVSPGIDLAEVHDLDCEIEFVSLGGELKEATLWFGPLRTAHRRATLLPAGDTLVGTGMEAPPLGAPGRVLYEPDPAVMRAGLVAELAAQLGAAQLDPDIAYLAADQRVDSPYARAFAIEVAFPFSLKKLRTWLRQHGVGHVVVKKRGSPLEPEALERSLRLRGDGSRVLILTQVLGRPFVLIGERLSSQA